MAIHNYFNLLNVFTYNPHKGDIHFKNQSKKYTESRSMSQTLWDEIAKINLRLKRKLFNGLKQPLNMST